MQAWCIPSAVYNLGDAQRQKLISASWPCATERGADRKPKMMSLNSQMPSYQAVVSIYDLGCCTAWIKQTFMIFLAGTERRVSFCRAACTHPGFDSGYQETLASYSHVIWLLICILVCVVCCGHLILQHKPAQLGRRAFPGVYFCFAAVRYLNGC